MANICAYRMQVKGDKRACLAFFGSVPVLDDKYILDQRETKDGYIIQFAGDCKWAVDMYTKDDDDMPAINLSDIPDDEEGAIAFGDDYWGVSMKSKSRIFDVEVYSNSCDIDECYYMNSAYYVNGEECAVDYDKTPEGIRLVDYEDEIIEFV